MTIEEIEFELHFDDRYKCWVVWAIFHGRSEVVGRGETPVSAMIDAETNARKAFVE
jgi:hypothetical protein